MNGHQTSVEGIFACGNVLHVHDLVDFVTAESRRAGVAAAKYIKNELIKGKSFETKPLKGINYIVPNKVNIDNLDDKLELFMRVDAVYKDVVINVYGDGTLIKTMKKKHLAPAEMESVKSKVSEISNIKDCIEIEVLV